MPVVTDVFGGSPLPLRVTLTVLFLAPLGLCLGAFMPIGLATVAGTTELQQEYVAWAWGVNGFASVVGSVLTTILSMTFGFNLVMILATATYTVGVAAMWRIPAPKAAPG